MKIIYVDAPVIERDTHAIRTTFQTCQQLIGGYIEIVNLPDGECLFVDEDGIPKGLSYNQTASALAGTVITGTAILLSKEEKKEILK